MKSLILALSLILPGAAFAANPLIDNPRQIKPGVIEQAMAPTLAVIGASTATLRTDLTTETTTRIAADIAINGTLSNHGARLNALAISTAALRVDVNANTAQLAVVATDTTTLASVIASSPTLPFISSDGTLEMGTTDVYGRKQIHFSGASSVLRLGSNAADGDPTNIDSEGIVIYDVNPSSRMARIKADRFGLTASDDANLYFFRADPTDLFFKNSTLTANLLGVNRSANTLEINGALLYADGSQGVGKVLTSDASGNANWQTPAAPPAETDPVYTGALPGLGVLAATQTWTGQNTFTGQMRFPSGADVMLGSNNLVGSWYSSYTDASNYYGYFDFYANLAGDSYNMYLNPRGNTYLESAGNTTIGKSGSTGEKFHVNGDAVIIGSVTAENGLFGSGATLSGPLILGGTSYGNIRMIDQSAVEQITLNANAAGPSISIADYMGNTTLNMGYVNDDNTYLNVGAAGTVSGIIRVIGQSGGNRVLISAYDGPGKINLYGYSAELRMALDGEYGTMSASSVTLSGLITAKTANFTSTVTAGRETVSNTCNAATTCSVDCSTGKIIIGALGCQTGGTTNPTDFYATDSDTYRCDTSVSANITVTAVCSNIN